MVVFGFAEERVSIGLFTKVSKDQNQNTRKKTRRIKLIKGCSADYLGDEPLQGLPFVSSSNDWF